MHLRMLFKTEVKRRHIWVGFDGSSQVFSTDGVGHQPKQKASRLERTRPPVPGVSSSPEGRDCELGPGDGWQPSLGEMVFFSGLLEAGKRSRLPRGSVAPTHQPPGAQTCS